MTTSIIVGELAGVRVALTLEEFEVARERAAQIISAPAGAVLTPATDESLLDAEALAVALSLPVSWIEENARAGKIPVYRAGRWVRYKRSEVEAVLRGAGVARANRKGIRK